MTDGITVGDPTVMCCQDKNPDVYSFDPRGQMNTSLGSRDKNTGIYMPPTIRPQELTVLVATAWRAVLRRRVNPRRRVMAAALL
jgi:hypothetical protein